MWFQRSPVQLLPDQSFSSRLPNKLANWMPMLCWHQCLSHLRANWLGKKNKNCIFKNCHSIEFFRCFFVLPLVPFLSSWNDVICNSKRTPSSSGKYISTTSPILASGWSFGFNIRSSTVYQWNFDYLISKNLKSNGFYGNCVVQFHCVHTAEVFLMCD